MKKHSIFIVFIILAGILLVTKSQKHSASFLIGLLYMAINFWLIEKTWSFVLKKKSIALAGLVIVLKYPLLFFSLMFILKQNYFEALTFVMGLIFYISIPIMGALQRRSTDKNKE